MLEAVGAVMAMAIMALFALTMFRALARCAPENRTMRPGLAWLWVIPIFMAGWSLALVLALARSLENEYRSRGLVFNPKRSKPVGLAMCVLLGGSIFLESAGEFLGPLGFVHLGFWEAASTGLGYVASACGIAFAVSWIWYWVVIHGLSKRLVQ